MMAGRRDHEATSRARRGVGCRRTASARAAEARLEDLSGGAPGQRGHDRDLAGVLEGGEPLPAVEDELARAGAGAGPEGDEGVDLRAERGVRHADDRGLDDLRVGDEARTV